MPSGPIDHRPGPTIRPIQFAHAVQYAQAYRSNGEGLSTYQCCRYALREAGIMDYADDWVLVLEAFLNQSPTLAEAWAERQLMKSLDRAFVRTGS